MKYGLRLLLPLVCWAVLILPARAARLYVGWGEYTSIQAAVDAAADHDTVLVNTGTWNGEVILDHPVTLIGQGSTQPLQKSEIANRVRVLAGATGSVLQGFKISGTGASANLYGVCVFVQQGNQGLLLQDCVISANVSGSSYPLMKVEHETTATLLRSCLLQNTGGNGSNGYGITHDSESSLRIENTIFNWLHCCVVSTDQNTCHAYIENCTFYSNNYLICENNYSASLNNNLFIWTGLYYCSSFSMQYNCSIYASFGGCGSTTNFTSTTFPLISDPGNSSPPGFYNPLLHDFHPLPGSVLIDAGDPQILDRDGSRSDIGCTGGANPFNFTGIPQVPVVTWLRVPSQVFQGQTLPVAARGIIGD